MKKIYFLPLAFISLVTSLVALQRPPRWPLVARLLTKWPLFTWVSKRSRSPKSAPPLWGLDGSISNKPTGSFSKEERSAFKRVDLPEPGGPVIPRVRTWADFSFLVIGALFFGHSLFNALGIGFGAPLLVYFNLCVFEKSAHHLSCLIMSGLMLIFLIYFIPWLSFILLLYIRIWLELFQGVPFFFGVFLIKVILLLAVFLSVGMYISPRFKEIFRVA